MERKKLTDKNSKRKQSVLSDWSLWVEQEGKLFLTQEKTFEPKKYFSQVRMESQV